MPLPSHSSPHKQIVAIPFLCLLVLGLTLNLDNQRHRLNPQPISETLKPLFRITTSNQPYAFILKPDYLDSISFYQGSFLAAILLFVFSGNQAAAITFGNYVFLAPKSSAADSSLLIHELIHTAQYRRDGFIPFVVKYSLTWLKSGYSQVPYETEAVRATQDIMISPKLTD